MRLTPSRLVYILIIVFFFVLFIQLTLDFFPKSSIIPLDEIKERMAERQMRVRDTCDKYNIRPDSSSGYSVPHPPVPQYGILYYQLQKSLVYCPVYKAASTSFLHWLLRMKGINGAHAVKVTRRQISDIAREHYPSLDYPAAAELLKESKRWMVVRHPFQRILSAYRDKLENSTAGREHGTVHFYEKYGKKIVAKYRTDKTNRIEPTFDEFVSYLIDTDLTLYADDHWIPVYLFCTPCLVDYDVIVHLETFQQDVRLLLHLTGEKTGPEWKHSSTKTDEKSYFHRLSREKILKLYDKYKVDFQMFGYDLDGYLLN